MWFTTVKKENFCCTVIYLSSCSCTNQRLRFLTKNREKIKASVDKITQ